MKKSSVKKALFLVIGLLSLLTGIIGIVLPIVPTTPLFLLAFYAFTKSSEKMEEWFRNSKFYKKYLEQYIRRKALTVKQKFIIQLSAGSMMLIPFIVVDNLHIRVALSIIFAIHVYVINFRIQTYRNTLDFHGEEMENEL